MTGTNRSLLAAIVVLALAVTALAALMTFSYIRLASQGTTQYEACLQGNVIRREDNRSHYADYHVFSFVAARFLMPTKTETVTQKKITSEFSGELLAAVHAKEWTPVTDCARAPDRTPDSVPFYKQLPPRSALQ